MVNHGQSLSIKAIWYIKNSVISPLLYLVVLIFEWFLLFAVENVTFDFIINNRNHTEKKRKEKTNRKKLMMREKKKRGQTNTKKNSVHYEQISKQLQSESKIKDERKISVEKDRYSMVTTCNIRHFLQVFFLSFLDGFT